MTRDFIDDFTDALDREGRKYLIIVCDKDDAGRRIRSNLSELPQRIAGLSRRDDLFDCISSALDENLQ
jgi:5S rRNA maturation endonuclease (ribonuclease M5)